MGRNIEKETRWYSTHRISGNLSKKQSIDATITVIFEIDGHKSILNEFFSGNIIGEILHLQGQSINYIEKGNPHNYVLDNFYLDINKNGDILKGKFKSRSGSGNALFKKIEKISPEDYHELL